MVAERPSVRGRERVWHNTTLSLLGGAVACAALAATAFLVPSREGPEVGFRIGLGLSAVAVGLAGALAWLIRSRITQIEVDDAGLRWSRLGVDRAQAWTTVSTFRRQDKVVFQGASQADPRKGQQSGLVRVEFADGPALRFTRAIEPYEGVADLIQHHATKALLKQKATELARGEAVFGPVTLRREGLVYKGKSWPWELNNYLVALGKLQLAPANVEYSRGETALIPLADIPDYAVLLRLMEKMGKPPAALRDFVPPSQRKYVG